MKIAIVGGGFTGLTAAYELGKKGHRVTLFEKEKTLGGLAHGFKKPGWDLPRAKSRGWHLEAAYHHLFTNDDAILSLIHELGLSDKLIIKRPITANYASSVIPAPSSVIPAQAGIQPQKMDSRFRGNDTIARNDIILPFDSPLHLLTYPGLSWADKLRTGALLASIKLYPAPRRWGWVNPFLHILESVTAKRVFLTIGGRAAWQTIWEPLMTAKFGPYADRVAASWLWARIKKRTPRLYYVQGGFHTLVTALEQAIKKHGGTIVHKRFNPAKAGLNLKKIDRTLLTIPMPTSIPHLHAQTLILETKEPILKDVYWLNVTDRSFPFLAVVAHTNMIDKAHYGGRHITYFGNYLPSGHPFLALSAKELLKIFRPFIQRLMGLKASSGKQESVKGKNTSHFTLYASHLFTGFYAQPVHELHYSRRAPKLETPTKGVYLANMDSIYPWDRGTNYAVELGRHAAEKIHKSQ